jgi:hypothetical protein
LKKFRKWIFSLKWVDKNLLFFLSFFLITGGAYAAGLPEPKVEFSADSYVQTGNYTSESKIYRSMDKERRELDLGDSKQVVISRMDKNVIWMLMPAQNLYMEMSLSDQKTKQGAGEFSYEEITQTVVGEEMIEGMKSIKSKISVKDFSGTTFQGYMWTTKDGITLKMDTVTVGKGQPFQIKMHLKNVKIGKQDPNIFEIPSGYTKMDMGFPFGGHGLGMEGMENGSR